MQVRIPGPIPDGLTVFETMRAEVDGRVTLWPRHLARLRRGCAATGFALDEDRVAALLAGLPGGTVLRARLTIDQAGQVALAHAPLLPNPLYWRVVLSDLRLEAGDPWLQIKTSHRPVYDVARAALPPGVDEALLRNEKGQLCEGTITSIFLRREGRLLTPPLSSGVLPGVLRETLLADGRAEEAVVTVGDLRDGQFYCGNALRGLIPAQLILT